MSKHKTRQQKIITQLQRKLEMQQPSADINKHDRVTYSYTTSPVAHRAPTVMQTATTISFIKHDLVKTALVTLFIIGAEILLYISLKTHTIILPLIGY